MFVMGSGWPILAAVITGSVIAELIARSGHYKSYTCEVIGYCVLMLGTAIGSYIPFLVMKDYYLKIAEGSPSFSNSVMKKMGSVDTMRKRIAILFATNFLINK